VQLALAEAINSAGVGASASILLVGHSQGGLIAANIAQTDKRVKGLVTFGAPISQLSDRIKVPTVAIQHKNDIVPKLGLNANPLAKNLVTVERVMPISTPIAIILEAHEITNYTKTAELADKSEEFGLKRVRELVLDRFFPQSAIGVETGEATLYKLERVD
jgi:pimeloyl-ACP methyl ester carboxylesterase